MITELDILNFQSHEETHLSFHPGVNIFVGSSDSGKTAIIRAIRWVVWNRPSGADFRSWSAKGRTSVELVTEEGIILRSKDKQDKYTLGISGHKDTEFTAFGTSVPEEISKLLNISEINLQSQLDSPFLLSETPGKVAEHFNKVAHLEMIDTATQNINSWIRELTSDIKYAEGQKLSLKEGLTKFEHLEKFEVEVEVLEDQEKEFTKLCNSKSKLEAVLNSHLLNDTKISKLQPLLEIEIPLNQIFKWKDEKEKKETEYYKLNFLLDKLFLNESNIKEKEEILTIETNVTYLLKLYSDKDKIDKEYKSLYRLSNSIVQINRSIEGAKQKHNDLHEKFEKAFPTGSVCPLCNQIRK